MLKCERKRTLRSGKYAYAKNMVNICGRFNDFSMRRSLVQGKSTTHYFLPYDKLSLSQYTLQNSTKNHPKAIQKLGQKLENTMPNI